MKTFAWRKYWKIFLDNLVPRVSHLTVRDPGNEVAFLKPFLSYFFAKKIPLRRRVGCVMDGWFSGSVRDVCMSHQSDWIF